MNILKKLNAERVNIVEADGTLKMSLYSSGHNPPAMMDGADIFPGHRDGSGASGIRFYNTEGDECGGMSFQSEKKEDGGYSSSLHFSFDQYKNDQVITMTSNETNGERQYGFTVYDRPDEHLIETVNLRYAMINAGNENDSGEVGRLGNVYKEKNVKRMWLGKTPDGVVSLKINDSKGRERVRVCFDPENGENISLFDEAGGAIYALRANAD